MHLDFFDEEPEEFFGLFGALAGEDLVELVGEPGEYGRVGRCVRLCAETVGEVGFLLAQCRQAGAVGADAFLAELGREVAVFEGLEVALQLRFQPADVGAGGGELFFEAGPFGLGVAGDVGERLFDEVAVAVEVGELGEDGCFEAFLGQPVAGAFGGAVLVAGGAGVVGLAAASAVRLANQAAVVRPSADESSTRRGDGPRPRISGRAVRPPRPLGQL